MTLKYITIVDDTDVQRLQLAINALVQWSDTWQLPISINKCCLLNVGKNSHGIVVSIGNSTLPVVTYTRDLGIIVSSDLSPSLHVTDTVSKAHMRAGLILRTFMSRDIHLLKRAFLVYVRPIVEHNSVIWSPYRLLHKTLMLLNQFNVDSPSDCQPLVTCHTMIV